VKCRPAPIPTPIEVELLTLLTTVLIEETLKELVTASTPATSLASAFDPILPLAGIEKHLGDQRRTSRTQQLREDEQRHVVRGDSSKGVSDAPRNGDRRIGKAGR